MDIYLDTVIREYTRLINNVDNIVQVLSTLFKWIGITIFCLMIWFSIGYIIWVRTRFKRAYALLDATPP